MSGFSLVMAILWVVLWLVTYAGLCARSDRDAETRWPVISDRTSVRGDMLFAALFSVTPPAWIVTLLVTGVYRHGLRWNVRPSSRNGGPVR